MLRLKAIGRDEDYPTDICAAARCHTEAVIVDATMWLTSKQVPLCETHWQVRCELEPEPAEEMTIEIVERPTSMRPNAARRVAHRRSLVDPRQMTLPLGQSSTK